LSFCGFFDFLLINDIADVDKLRWTTFVSIYIKK
jgi:hypothetical protein